MPTAVDIFAGAGGISLGLRNAGWDVVAACDNNPTACATYTANHPDTCMVQGDIQSPQTLDALVEATRGRRVDMVANAAPVSILVDPGPTLAVTAQVCSRSFCRA